MVEYTHEGLSNLQNRQIIVTEIQTVYFFLIILPTKLQLFKNSQAMKV